MEGEIPCELNLSNPSNLKRHPLQELAVASYVPNDAFLVGGQSRHRTVQRRGSPDITAALNEERPAEEPNVGPNLLVMTGPNYSGKSVYLKQVALAVYMTHVGRCAKPIQCFSV